MSRTRKEYTVSDADERIEDAKPVADRAEQERPETDEPDDPERAASSVLPSDAGEADIADVSEQLREVPLDDEDRPAP